MLTALELAGSLAVAVYAMTVPGLCLLRKARVGSLNAVDQLLAAVLVSTAYTGMSVYLSLLLGVYRPWAAVLFLLAPVVALLPGRKMQRNEGQWSPPVRSGNFSALGAVDRVAVIAVSVSLTVTFVDAVTSPITWWDGYIVWDKWAVDWAERGHLWKYMLGGYPQLLPFLSSVVYLLAGGAQEVLPIQAFALHAVHVMLGGIVLVASLRLASLLALPAWPLVFMWFGNRTFRSSLLTGAADMLLWAVLTCAVALVVSLVRGQLKGRWAPGLVVVASVFTVSFAKATGILCLAFIGAFYAIAVRLPGRSETVRARSLLKYSFAGLCLWCSFYVQQVFTELLLQPQEVDVRGVNFSLRSMQSVLAAAARAQTDTTSFGSLFLASVRRIAADYSLTTLLGCVCLAGLGILSVVSLTRREGRCLALAVAAYGAVWFLTAPYDTRNLLPALVAVGPVLVYGWRAAVGRGPLGGAKRALAIGVLSCCCVFCAHGWLREDALRLTTLGHSSQSLRERWQAMRGSADDRIRLYFAGSYEDYQFLKTLPLARKSAHIVATDHLYRFFRNGSYGLCHWPWVHGRPGDLYVSSAHRPPNEEQWALIKAPNVENRGVWVYMIGARTIGPGETSLTGRHPPTLVSRQPLNELVFRGDQSLAVYNVPVEDRKPGATIAWRVATDTLEGPGEVMPIFLVYDNGVVNGRGTRLLRECGRPLVSQCVNSGILTLTEGEISKRLRDGVLVGISCNGAGTRVKLLDFRVAVFY